MGKRKKKTLDRVWTPFRRTDSDEQLEALAKVDERYIGTWVNSLYQVQIRLYETTPGLVYWLSVVNRDRTARHDWRELQRIKNELVGPEHEGVELYPAESRLVDTNNQFHLHVFVDPSVRVPLGYVERDVADVVDGTAHRQRPFRVPPPDLNARVGQTSIGVCGVTRDRVSEDTTEAQKAEETQQTQPGTPAALRQGNSGGPKT